MKIKTNSHRWLCAGLALLATFGGTFALLNSNGEAYAATTATTYEEFDAQLGDAREKLQELEDKLGRLKTIEDYDKYQDFWDMIEVYTATWEAGEVVWQGFSRRFQGTFYDADLYEEIIAKLRAIDPDFQPTENISIKDSAQGDTEAPSNDLVSDLVVVHNPTIAVVGYTMIRAAHIRSALNYAPTYFEEYATETGLSLGLVNGFCLYALDGGIITSKFTDRTANAILVAELYNRISERDAFSDTHRVLAAEHLAEHKSLQESISLLTSASQLVDTRYFPGAVSGWRTFSMLIKSDIGKTEYTLKELVEYLPSHEYWKAGADKDAIIAHFQYALENELQIARNSLRIIDPTLADLDSKSIEDLAELSRNIISSVEAVEQQAGSTEVKTLAELIATFDNDMLVIDEYPGDKYFKANEGFGTIIPRAESTAALSLDDGLHHFTAQEIIDRDIDEATLWDYYGRLGLAALEFDRTVTRNLLQHETWPVIEYDDEDEEDSENSSNSGSQTPNPSAPTQSTDGSTTEPSDSTPNTGILSKIIPNAEAALGIAVATSTFIAFIIIRRRHSR